MVGTVGHPSSAFALSTFSSWRCWGRGWELCLLSHGPTSPWESRKSQQHRLLCGSNGNYSPTDGLECNGVQRDQSLMTTVATRLLSLALCCHHVLCLLNLLDHSICFPKTEPLSVCYFSTMISSLPSLQEPWVPAPQVSSIALPPLIPNIPNAFSSLCLSLFFYPFLNLLSLSIWSTF